MAAMPITPDFESLREPGRNGRLLGYYDARRGILKIKRSDGPECTLDAFERHWTRAEAPAVALFYL